MAVLLEYHRHDVGSSCRGLLAHHYTDSETDYHGSDDAREHEMVRHVDRTSQELRRIEAVQRLLVRVRQPGHNVHCTRRIHRRHDCARAEMAAEQDERYDEQRDVEHVAERSDLHGREYVVQHDAGAVHAAGNYVVRIDEVYVSGSKNRTADEYHHPGHPPTERKNRLRKFLQVYFFQVHVHTPFRFYADCRNSIQQR